MIRDALRFAREALTLYDFVASHPLSAGNVGRALARAARWQIGSRILGTPAVVQWVDGARLIVAKGRAGLTGNLYTGLHEYEDMSFVLHYLRDSDVFLDVGANVGAYTVLAAAVVGARTLSFEPVPDTFAALRDNVRINHREDICSLYNVALSDREGELQFTADLDAMNHAAVAAETGAGKTISCSVLRLDDVVKDLAPRCMKLDVEGYESKVLDGAARTLESLQAIVIELNGSGERYGVSDQVIVARLEARGFAPYTYHPAERALERRDHPVRGANTIYLRDVADAQRRVQTAPSRSVFGRTI